MRAVEEMEEAAAQERARRDEHDAMAARKIEELEAQRLAAEAERLALRQHMQVFIFVCASVPMYACVGVGGLLALFSRCKAGSHSAH